MIERLAVLPAQEEALAEQFPRSVRREAVRRGVNQQLGQRRGIFKRRDARRRGRQVAARAVAPERDARGVGPEFVRVTLRPPKRRERVFQSGRERVLGREPVVHAEDVRACVQAEQAADLVVRLQVACASNGA